MIDTQLFIQSLPALMHGAGMTLQIAFFSGIIGLILGTLLGLWQTSKSKLLQWLVTIYVTLIRGTPLLIQITFAFYGLPQFGIQLQAFWVAVVAIGLNSAAYVSQIIKSGIRSINKGQIEAGRVLGLTHMQIIQYVILPQAFRVIIPSLGNEFITLVKESSLASTIGVVELTKEGIFIRGRTFDAITTFAAVGLVYLIITTTISLLVNWFEARMNRHVTH